MVFDGKALSFEAGYPSPVPGRGEALVRVAVAGICNTDMEITRGYMGFRGVIGHEFAGVVERAEGRPDLEGKRVTGEINIPCGACRLCASGMGNHCPSRAVLGIAGKDGAMAEYLTLPAGNLHLVPEGLSDEEAVFTEPLAAAFEIAGQVHVGPSQRVLVLGDGKLGLLSAMALSLTGADVTLAGRHREKLAVAGRRGVRTALAVEMEGKRDYDLVVEATGSAEGFGAALAFVRPRGTIALKSTVHRGAEMNLTPVVVDEITVVGSRCGPFAPALRALAGGLVDVKPLVTAVYPFERAGQAFERAREKGSLKVLLDFRP
ncbi:MAG: alcohol dehydrogenase catalytic domain-containing protein [Thermodesulfovibrionales bacterium]